VFTGEPLVPGERIVVQILATENMYIGSLAFGLTSCDPAGLDPDRLPEDSDMLLDRSEYWVVSKVKFFCIIFLHLLFIPEYFFILFRTGTYRYTIRNRSPTSVADPDPGCGAFLAPWIRDPGWVESQHPDSGIWDEQPGSYFLELRNYFFWLKYLNFLMRIRDGDSSDPGWKKVGSGIRDNHPGSRNTVANIKKVYT
jgi:hypothetical protein